MSNVLTDWRVAVMKQLATLQGGLFAIVAGERDGKSRDRNLACVFAPSLTSDGGNVNFARPVLIVRAWLQHPKTPSVTVPHDPEPVEQLMIDLAECLKGVQRLPQIGQDGLYAFVVQIRPDYEDWGVEATLQAWTGNPAVQQG